MPIEIPIRDGDARHFACAQLPKFLIIVCLAALTVGESARTHAAAIVDETAVVLGGGGESWVRREKQFAADVQGEASFGASVATDGNWLAVGAPLHSIANPVPNHGSELTSVGKVDLYERIGDDWILRQSIPGTQEGGRFGASVALLGDDLLIGSPGHDQGMLNIGRAFFFRREGTAWIANGAFSCCFANAAAGQSVALSRTRFDKFAYVGAPKARTSAAAPATGRAFAFRKEGPAWVTEDLPTPGDLAGDDEYGAAIDASSDAVVVGAYVHDTDGVFNSGAAYVFDRSTEGDWSQTQKLGFSVPMGEDRFGRSVAIYGAWIAVGSVGRTVAGHPNVDTGAVQIFQRSAPTVWSRWQVVTGLNADSGDAFGESVALDATHLLVGALYDSTLAQDYAGSAYFFNRGESGNPPQDDWQQSAKFFPANPAENDAFGASVALAGQVAVVGADGDDTEAGPLLADAGSITTFLTDRIFADGFDL